jgi:hypothetical protein
VKKIINKSEHVIVARNSSFSKEIPIGTEITIHEDEIGGDHTFAIERFSLKQMKSENDFEEVRTVGNRYGLRFYMHSFIPMKTVVDLQDCSEVVITDENIEFHFLTGIFKMISLERLHVENSPNKEKLFFVNNKEKKYFFRWILAELIITFLLLPLLTCVSFLCFTGGEGWLSCLLTSGISLFFAYSYFRKLAYLLYFKFLKS